MDETQKAMLTAVSGLQAQADRLRVIAENMANADSLPTGPSQLPYRRKVLTFRTVLDGQTGAELVKVDKVGVDNSPFHKKYEPGHPAADAAGYVLAPNVNPLIEVMDMREAQRSYQANLDVVTVARSLRSTTVNLLR